MYSLPTFGVLIFLGSAIPFLPTGELVSGSAALSTTNLSSLTALFLISWICSSLGDTTLLLLTRLGLGPVQGWLDRRPFGQKVRWAQHKINQNLLSSVITGRLIPGGRVPVILALGISPLPLRRFLPPDMIACALWAALYTGIGALGGTITDSPTGGLLLAVGAAVTLSAIIPLTRHLKAHRHEPATEPTSS